MMPMAETRSSTGGGRPAVYGARRKAISVYMPPAWDHQLRQLSKETQTEPQPARRAGDVREVRAEPGAARS